MIFTQRFNAVLLILVTGLNLFAQNKQSILELDEIQFQNEVKKSPELWSKNDLELLNQRIISQIRNEEQETALLFSKKALILAESIGDKLLVARSLHTLGNINRSLEKLDIAASYYEKSMEAYATLENSDAMRIEAGFLMTDWASLFTDSYYASDQKELVQGFQLLYFPFELSNSNQSPGFEDLKYQTYLKIGQAFGVSGNFISQIVWLEKLASMKNSNRNEKTKFLQLFELHIELERAYRRIGDYEKSSENLKSLDEISKKTNASNQLRYLRELSDFYTDISSFQKISGKFKETLQNARKGSSQLSNLYTFKIINLLKEGAFKDAKTTLNEVEILEKKGTRFNPIDLAVIRAVFACFEGDNKECEKQFGVAEYHFVENNSVWRSKLFILYWKSRIALWQKDYVKLKEVSNEYLNEALKHNSKDSLPLIYLNLTKAELGLGNTSQAKTAIDQAAVIIDVKRATETAAISVGISENIYEVYQLQTDLKLAENKISDAFQSSERLKGRWLNDKISRNQLKQKVIFDPELKSKIFEVNLQILKNPKDQNLFSKLSELEKKAIFDENKSPKINEMTQNRDDLISDLEKSSIDEQTAVISYCFRNDGGLTAFVWQRGKDLQVKQLPINRLETEKLAIDLQEKIKTLIFFKNEGQQIYDKLLKPLNVQAKHLIIIPDQALWKIPFQALSADGKTYLIENTMISYAPSTSILLNLLKSEPPKRQSFQVFSNSHFNSTNLKYADVEATGLAKMFGVQPYLNSNTKIFRELSGKSDILHFSMHAEVDKDAAFNSFLGFKTGPGDDGKLTVDDLLKIQLKKESMVFLASCDTNNVLKSEGLVSLAWGMLAAGASTVISAQWEANDKSSRVFSSTFYKRYKQGMSSAEALQQSALELIRKKSDNMHEPYYWADFTLNGDFR